MNKLLLPIFLSCVAIAASAAPPPATISIPAFEDISQPIGQEPMIVSPIPGTDEVVCMTRGVVRISDEDSSIAMCVKGQPTVSMIAFMEGALEELAKEAPAKSR